jgi:hypothetical protein
METISESTNLLESLSQDLRRTVERASTAVVAINARRHSSSSGVCGRDGIIVTVKFHISSIFAKLGAANRAEAVTLGIRQGLIMV